MPGNAAFANYSRSIAGRGVEPCGAARKYCLGQLVVSPNAAAACTGQ